MKENKALKITAFIGSARKKYTYKAAERLLTNIQQFGNVEYEIIRLSDYNLKYCKGCKLCCDKGEELCPLKDDRDIIIEKMSNSDGVIFAAPNYSFQVSALMKLFLDRLGFVFHRPSFFGKTYTSIVTQGVYGGDKIVKYFNFIGHAMGFNMVKGSCITTLEPMTEKAQKKIDKKIDKQSKKFYSQLMKQQYPKPSLFDLFMFRASRTRIQYMLDEKFRDFTYYRDKGWFESSFYYPIKLGPFKRMIGSIVDRTFTRQLKKT